MPRETNVDQALIEAMIARASHLENILVDSLLGLLLTTTFAILAALYTVKKETPADESGAGTTSEAIRLLRGLDPTWPLLFVALLYACISGYYYYMLSHFYAAVQSAFALIQSDATQRAVAPIWSLFRIPPMFGFSPKTRSIIYLIAAPAFPVGFSCVMIIAFWRALRQEWTSNVRARAVLVVALLMQLSVAAMLAAYPFTAFTKAIGTYIERVEKPRQLTR